MTNKINVIDLFAGPGGLGEGFSSFSFNKCSPFDIKLSVEKEPNAHKTLTLRAFFRKFRHENVPDAYYDYLRNAELTHEYLENLYPAEWRAAVNETMGQPSELGTDDDKEIFARLNAIKKASSEPFVVIGGPPCQAYSVMGRIKNRSIDNYIAENDNRHFLYKEYLKVLDVVKPEVFVMENVRGILSAHVNDQQIFPMILDDLSRPAKALGKRGGEKYAVYSLANEPFDFDGTFNPIYRGKQDYVIRSENFGVPQKRHRVILLGVREDIASVKQPDTLQTSEPVYTNHVLEGLPRLRSSVSRRKDDKDIWYETVMSESQKLVAILGKSDPELADYIDNIVSNLKVPKRQCGDKRFLPTATPTFRGAPERLRKFMEDKRLNGCLNHFARSHMASDLQRYMFCSSFSDLYRNRRIPSPTRKHFPKELAPNHRSWESGKFVDRFRVQFRGSASSTITSHINRDGHFFIHYDPYQCRSLTVREAARLQTFPDNYFFEGNQTQQYIQVGNAVPPYLALNIAEIVHQLLK